MSSITVEQAAQELDHAGGLTVSSRYGDVETYTFMWGGRKLQAQGYISDRTQRELPGVNIFSPRSTYGGGSLHPVLRLYQDYVAIQRMTQAGYTVLLDQLSDRRYRVRVQRKEGRKFVYNEHTSSTSGYPIVAALEKWHAHVDQAKRLELEADTDKEYEDRPPTRFEVFFYQSDRDGVFYHGQTRRIEWNGDLPPLGHPRIGVTGIRHQPYLRVEVEAPTAATAESRALKIAQEWTSEQDTVVRMKAEVA